jgi:hypothetical protein
MCVFVCVSACVCVSRGRREREGEGGRERESERACIYAYTYGGKDQKKHGGKEARRVRGCERLEEQKYEQRGTRDTRSRASEGKTKCMLLRFA